MDDSFSNIVLAIMWGRCVNDSVRKFLQFQISYVVLTLSLHMLTRQRQHYRCRHHVRVRRLVD